MPKTTISPENRTADASQFPRLKLEKDERNKILAVEKNPMYEFVHTLRAPKIVNGVPEMETVNQRDGGSIERFKLDFIGRPICHGDINILEDKGVDPKNCPACRVAMESDMVDHPTRRYAMHVIKYATKPGTFELQSPYQVSVLVWAFTEKIFNKLIDFTQEAAAATEGGSLQDHDLNLGPCTNPAFQQFDIQLSLTAEWLKSADRKKLTLETLKENRLPEDKLSEFCGRTVAATWLAEDLDRVKSRWQIANGRGSVVNHALLKEAETESLAEGLDDLLTVQTGSPTVDSTPVEVAPSESLDDIAPTADAATAPAVSVSSTPSATTVVSTEDLLADLDSPALTSASTSDNNSDKPAVGASTSFDELFSSLG